VIPFIRSSLRRPEPDHRRPDNRRPEHRRSEQSQPAHALRHYPAHRPGGSDWAPEQRRRRRQLLGVTLRATACLAAVGVAVALLAHGPARPDAARADLVADVASPARGIVAEADVARVELARALAAPHAGRPEKLTHPAADSLGSTFAPPAAGSVLAVSKGPLGIDVSDHQGNVDWPAAAAAGARFAWVKATEGTYYTDSTYFAQQYNGSYQAGMMHAAYHFAIPNNSSGAAQADFFVANGGGWSPDGRTLPGMLDVENNPYGPTCYGLTPTQMVAWVVSFSDQYDALTGRYPVLYTNASFWDTCTGGSGAVSSDPLDLAAWGPNPAPVPEGWSAPTFWQYTDSGILGGDTDTFLGTYAGLQAFAYGTSPIDPAGPVTATTTTTSTTTTSTTTCTSTTLAGTSGTSGSGNTGSGNTGAPCNDPTSTTTDPPTTTTTDPPTTTTTTTTIALVAPRVAGWQTVGWSVGQGKVVAWGVNGYPAATASLSGSLPKGMAWHAADGRLVVWGRPWQAGTAQVGITASNSQGNATHTVTFVVHP